LELDLHELRGHVTQRPKLFFRGREIRESRLVLTTESKPTDWRFQNIDELRANNVKLRSEDLGEFLMRQDSGVVEVTAISGELNRNYYVRISIQKANEVAEIDALFETVINQHQLSSGLISDFNRRARAFKSAKEYSEAYANYLYGAFDISRDAKSKSRRYTNATPGERLNRAANFFSGYDRYFPEVICAINAFHHNQFETAMGYTQSETIASISMYFYQKLQGVAALIPFTYPERQIDSVDLLACDAHAHEILVYAGSDNPDTKRYLDLVSLNLSEQDLQKAQLLHCEQLKKVRKFAEALKVADGLKDIPAFENWYQNLLSKTNDWGN